MSLLAHEERSVTKQMPRVATIVPAETDLLCEGCGYILNGLHQSSDSNCPECGKPIQGSIGIHRVPSEFETAQTVNGFLRTTKTVILSPRTFYQNIATRESSAAALRFAKLHRLLASILFGVAATGHLVFILNTLLAYGTLTSRLLAIPLCVIGLTAVIYSLLSGLTRLATWLSAIEAKYWGMRLPHQVVLRGMQYHAAHYLPVGLLAGSITWGYQILIPQINHRYDDIYLYALCGVVVLSALYLFRTYWIAMRSMMFANR